MAAAMRRMSAMLPLLASAVLIAACGKGQLTTSSGHSTPAGGGSASAPHATGKPLTSQQAQALVRAINLTASDVPGFAASRRREGSTPAEKHLEEETARCLGARTSGKALAEGSSQSFEHRRGILALSVSSSVTVVATPAAAAKELSKARRGRVRGCLARYLGLVFKSLHQRGLQVGKVSVQEGTPPASGATDSVGWRLSATLTDQRVRIPVYVDILGFTYGAADVLLFSSGLPVPFPAAPEQQLYTLLLHRAASFH